jgi:hypothetical protein
VGPKDGLNVSRMRIFFYNFTSLLQPLSQKVKRVPAVQFLLYVNTKLYLEEINLDLSCTVFGLYMD